MTGYLPKGHLPDGHLPDGHLPAAVRHDVRFDFRARLAAQAMPMVVDNDTGYTFADCYKDPDESLKVRLILFSQCANYWKSNEQVLVNEFFRPLSPTGYSYEVTAAGTTGARAPRWPESIGATVQSGSAVFTCRAAGENGLLPILEPDALSDPPGLIVSDVSVEEITNILATYIGGNAGDSFDAVFRFQLNDVARVARQRILVVKR